MCDCVSLYDILSLLLCSASTLELDSLLGSRRAGKRASGRADATMMTPGNATPTGWVGMDGMCLGCATATFVVSANSHSNSTHHLPIPIPCRQLAGFAWLLAGQALLLAVNEAIAVTCSPTP